MNTTLLLPVFAASVLGSVHCAGMCGGFVGFYAGTGEDRKIRWGAHLAYNVGRLVTYATLGALAGAAGAALDLAGTSAGVGRIAAVVVGVLMIGWGLVVLLDALGMSFARPMLPRSLLERGARLLASLRRHPPVLRAALLGLSSTLLPCGWLYAFVLTAAAAGSAPSGALVMIAFWSGTVPVLLGLGVFVQRATHAIRAQVPLLSAAVMIAIGLVNLSSRANAPALSAASIRAAIAPGTELTSQGVQTQLPPCHRHRVK